jgi:hypothetical protein
MKNQDIISPRGHLEIVKIWNTGQEEIVFSEKNTIVSGMGVGLALMFAGSGSDTIKDYQIGRFQVGTSSHTTYGASTYELASALTLGNYGAAPDIRVSSLSQMVNGNVVTQKAFGVIPFNLTRKVDKTSVQFGIFLGPNTANVASQLKEIGLFMNNPFKYSPETSILVAYKPFSPIAKTDQFSLLFKWTIIF